ncbi:MAG: GspE/PulE family protein [Sulfurihydrogenibium sp.]|uniref:GspE/PulE family protein n=1 Tax=Sulfurihydrogenibium sp. TaxID=2053621 RepID=UPI003D0C0288
MLIGEILRDKFGISESSIRQALKIQEETGELLGTILIQMGVITESQLIEALSYQLNLPIYDKNFLDIQSLENISNLNVEFLLKNQFIPVFYDTKQEKLYLVTNNPINFDVLNYLNQLGLDYQLMLAEDYVVKELSKNFVFGGISSEKVLSLESDEDFEKLKEVAFESPVIKYLNTLLNRATELKATDIHIEPMAGKFRVRFRIDGILREIDELNESFYTAVLSRIKLLANLDIAERRLPQDGKFSVQVASKVIDVRVSTIPMVFKEGAVLRLLYRERLSFNISTLGIEEDHIKILLETIKKPYGMFLITGPTGSGKTTTLYSLLTILNNNERKIITIEDPVEYQINGINQIQVRNDIGLTFASALRSILRHDPDVIMVGEIRDRETAEISIQSALTGHLVLSTLHTNDAPSSLSRLLEMGIEDFLINSAILSVSAQRILRRVCPFCKEEYDYPEDIKREYKFYEIYDRFKNLFKDKPVFYRGKGCEKCAGTGYQGRVAIFEIFEYNDDLKERFIHNKSSTDLKNYLIEKYNYRTLRDDGIIKVLKGITTLEEVLRVT